MSQAEREARHLLIAEGRIEAERMAAAVRDKPADHFVRVPAETFAGLATLIRKLAGGVQAAADEEERARAALARIAALDIRAAAELLELGAWKKISAELQAIAQEATGQRRRKIVTRAGLPAESDAAATGGIRY